MIIRASPPWGQSSGLNFYDTLCDEAVIRMPYGRAEVAKQAVEPQRPSKLRVGFVLAPRFTLAAFANFIDAVRLAADEGDRSRQVDCEWAVLGDRGETIESSCGLHVQPWAPLEDPTSFDYIVVVGGLLHGKTRASSNTNAFLKAAAKAKVPLVGLCTGSFILARAGLLNGYQVCVSWFHINEFREEFPKLSAESTRLFVIDRDRLTCAGGTSVVHLASHLIEKHCGRAQAIKSLRILIEQSPLPSGAWQPEEVVTRPAHDSLVKRAMLEIEENISSPLPLPDLADLLGISVRQLQRRFEADIGIGVREYRRNLQLSRAKWLVEHTDRSMTEIALDCGFSDSAHFSRTFREHFQVVPSRERQKTRSSSDAL
ncbi:MAG: GlxA family transcriptional regulator [Sphingomonas sp.]|uniref:GlxA family transcriptional regulator n=1 Tax=Sphingomonas sp. TaxID=28214 RepID=UPI003F80595B